MFYAGMARVDRREVLEKIIKRENLPLVLSVPDADDDEALRIIKIVCDYFDISMDAVLGHRKQQEVVSARHWAMYLIRDTLGITYSSIGQYFMYRKMTRSGERITMFKDHATVMYACNKVKDYIQVYPEEAQTAKILNKLL